MVLILSQESGIIGGSLCRNDALLNPIQFYLTSFGCGQFARNRGAIWYGICKTL